MKKGFTLIEVIGTLILMAAVALISIPVVEKQIKEGKEKLFDSQIQSIELSAENWLSDNYIYKPSNGETITIMLSQLKQGGYVKKDIKNPKTEELFPNDMLIEIINDLGIISYNVLIETGSDYGEYDINTPSIVMNGEIVTTTPLNETYIDLGVIAKTSDGTLINDVTVIGSVDTSKIGTYVITYSVNDEGKTNSLARTVNVKDEEKPVLSIPVTELTLYDNEISSTDFLADVTATDNSGNVNIITKGNLSIVAGKYTVTYIATDSSGNVTSKNRTVKVLSSGNPIVTMGSSIVDINVGENINLMDGISAVDANGYPVTNITCSIDGGSCDTSSLSGGDYTITYTATDSNSNVTNVTRTLSIISASYVDASGANAPELFNNMVAVKHNGTNWVVADTTQEWYNYGNKEWANAVVLKDSVTKNVGDTINVDTDVSQMYVWIPRYKYTIFNEHSDTQGVSAQSINIEFINGTGSDDTVDCSNNADGTETCTDITNGSITAGLSTYTHPAFTLGSKELTGIWVGKYETSQGSTKLEIKPNVTSWRNATVSTFYTEMKDVSTDYALNADSHMMKNMEWGAVAYLSHSIYGMNDEVWINNSSTFTTGCAGSSVSASSYSGCQNAYDTATGQNASTTGNIYGVYDMSGGAYEYVMGNMKNSSGDFYSSSAGFTTNPESQYYDVYKYDASSYTSHDRGKLGDATKETLITYGSYTGGWHSDYATFPASSSSWFLRGGYYSYTSNAGVFYFSHINGNVGGSFAARLVVSAID